MALLGQGKQRTLLGQNKGQYKSMEDLYRAHWNTDENAKRAEDFLARLNGYTQSVGEKTGSLKNAYSDKDIFESFDSQTLGDLEQEYNDFIKPYLKYNYSEDASDLDSMVSKQLGDLKNLGNLFSENAKKLSQFGSAEAYDFAIENEEEYSRIDAMSDAEYDAYIKMLQNTYDVWNEYDINLQLDDPENVRPISEVEKTEAKAAETLAQIERAKAFRQKSDQSKAIKAINDAYVVAAKNADGFSEFSKNYTHEKQNEA